MMDWKDALSRLKESGDIPTDNSPEPAEASGNDTLPSQKGTLHVVIEKKGRNGKTATIIEGFTGSDSELEELAKSLKKRLGTGGSARGGEILIQGDRKREVTDLLVSMGFKTKG